MSDWTVSTRQPSYISKVRTAQTHCKRCGKLIRWAKTTNGRMMPLEASDLSTHWGKCNDQG